MAMDQTLSILIPSRNEEFLARTVEDLLSNIEGDTEIIVGLDGEWALPELEQHERVTVVYYDESIGQRAMTNQLCRLSKAKYVMKIDAHCAVDKGFDVKMMAKMHDNWTMIPVMRNLHAFDWVCDKGHRRYQGPSGACTDCGGDTHKEVVWNPKTNPQSTSYRFDNTLHFQYFGEYKSRPEYIEGLKDGITETMSIQGSCFMLTREKYWELDICDEAHGSWGQQGVEVACKTWLSGGRVVVNHDTWYAHMFRTNGDFTFPYPNPGISKAREYSRELWFNNKWDKAIYPLQWLVDKFSPVPDWDVSKGAIFYTDNKVNPKIREKVQDSISKGMKGRRIVSISLEPIDFGDNIHMPLERGYLTMFKQILAGLEALDTDIVFFCEHDVLYHPSHFDFIPEKQDVYYYNTNVWKLRAEDGHAMRTDDCRQLSGLCCYRELAIQHYRERVKRVEADGFSRKMGFEPGTHNRAERVDDFKSQRWESALPNVDIRHDTNLTPNRWSKDEFRDQRYTKGWQETDDIPGWGRLEFLTS